MELSAKLQRSGVAVAFAPLGAIFTHQVNDAVGY